MSEDAAEVPYSSDNAADQDESSEHQPVTENWQGRAAAGNRRTLQHLWLISYSDFMTILMIFFLGMYGYTVMAKAALLKQHKMTYTEFSRKMDELSGKLGAKVDIKEDVGKVTMDLPDQVLFPSGRATLNQAARSTLEELANSLKLVDGDVIVEGHTDDVPVVGGKFESNWELSAARAFAVIEALTDDGVPPERLAAWGFGENRPIVPNVDAASRARNRRIEIVLLKKIKK